MTELYCVKGKQGNRKKIHMLWVSARKGGKKKNNYLRSLFAMEMTAKI